MKATIEGNELVVRVPLNQPLVPSQSGKTLVVASSYGNKATDLDVQGRKVTIGLNAYISAKRLVAAAPAETDVGDGTL